MLASSGDVLLFELGGRLVQAPQLHGAARLDRFRRAAGGDRGAQGAQEALDQRRGLRLGRPCAPEVFVRAAEDLAGGAILVVGERGACGATSGSLVQPSRASLLPLEFQSPTPLLAAPPCLAGCFDRAAGAGQRRGDTIFLGPAQGGKFRGGGHPPAERLAIACSGHGAEGSTVKGPGSSSPPAMPIQRAVTSPSQRPASTSPPSGSRKPQRALSASEE